MELVCIKCHEPIKGKFQSENGTLVGYCQRKGHRSSAKMIYNLLSRNEHTREVAQKIIKYWAKKVSERQHGTA